MVTIIVELPHDVAAALSTTWPDVPRRFLEILAVDGTENGALGRADLSRLLGLSFWDTEAFLKARRAYLPYSEADLNDDRRDLDGLAPR